MEKTHFFKNVLSSDSIAESLEHLRGFSKSFLGSEQICVLLWNKKHGSDQLDVYNTTLSDAELTRLKRIALHTDLFATIPEGDNLVSAISLEFADSSFKAIFAFRLLSDTCSGTLAFCFEEPAQPPEDALEVCNLIRLHMEHLIEKIHFRRQLLQLKTYENLVNTLRIKDAFTVNHCYNVSFYSALLGNRLELPFPIMEQLKIASLLHDIGKLAIPDSILLKPDKLTNEEFQVIKKHPMLGYELLKEYPDVEPMLPVVRWHHERMDGLGYPDGLAGEQIPLQVRIVSLADAFDAMTSTRVYRSSLSIEEVKEQMLMHAGTQFDETLIHAFMDVLNEQKKMKLLQSFE